MSVQSQIDRIVSNITAAFTAIGNKGGTVPESKTSGNLASAIASIPSGGATVRRAEGTFTVSDVSGTYIPVGFRPDYVMFYVQGSISSTTVNFLEADNVLNGSYSSTLYVGGATPYFFAELYPNRGDDGFDIGLYMVGYSLEYLDQFEEVTFGYIAVKYT